MASVVVKAVIDSLDGTPAYEREVELRIERGYVHMRGGPTGYESAPVAGLAAATQDWCACVGTPGRWDRCVVPLAEIQRAMPLLEEPAHA